MKPTLRTPKVCPTWDQLSQAVSVLNDQFLHVYQVLYFAEPRLTSPGQGGPLRISREAGSVGDGQVTTHLKVYHPGHEQKGLYFRTNCSEGAEEILSKARMLAEGASLSRVHPKACCGYAKRRPCVCEVSFECPLHGTRCIGSHD